MIVREDMPPTPDWVLPPRDVVEDLTIPTSIELGYN